MQGIGHRQEVRELVRAALALPHFPNDRLYLDGSTPVWVRPNEKVEVGFVKICEAVQLGVIGRD